MAVANNVTRPKIFGLVTSTFSHEISSVEAPKEGKFEEDSFIDILFQQLPSHMHRSTSVFRESLLIMREWWCVSTISVSLSHCKVVNEKRTFFLQLSWIHFFYTFSGQWPQKIKKNIIMCWHALLVSNFSLHSMQNKVRFNFHSNTFRNLIFHNLVLLFICEDTKEYF